MICVDLPMHVCGQNPFKGGGSVPVRVCKLVLFLIFRPKFLFIRHDNEFSYYLFLSHAKFYAIIWYLLVVIPKLSIILAKIISPTAYFIMPTSNYHCVFTSFPPLILFSAYFYSYLSSYLQIISPPKSYS